MTRAPEGSEWVALGMLGKVRGLRGDLWFRPYNEDTEAIARGVSLRVVLRDASKRMLVVESVSAQGTGIVIHFVGVDDRASVDPLVGASVELQRKDFPPLAEGEYYHCDLVGVRVVDLEGREVGTVQRVEAYPTVDALVVETAKGTVELPITDDVVQSLDLVARVAVVDAGWLED